MYRLNKRKSTGLAAATGWRARAGEVCLAGMGVAAARAGWKQRHLKRPSRAESWTPPRRLVPAPCSCVDFEGAQ